jgi:WD40 repeat protein
VAACYAEAKELLEAIDREFREQGPPRPPGGYRLRRLVGRGGMARVYEAEQLQPPRVVAFKVMGPWGLDGQQEWDRAGREMEALGKLSHPNVVRIFDAGQYARRRYFSMEFCAGGSLAGRLADGPLDPDTAALHVRTLAEAVQAAHRAGVVHRDLKPANVLLDADGGLKVADFGLAKELGTPGGLTLTGAVMGTPSYMAPEQARGSKDVGPLADVYALGAILYQCLTGRPPFDGATSLEIVHRVANEEPVPPRRYNAAVPVELERICMKCLAKEPGRRFGNAGELAADLGNYLNGLPLEYTRSVGVFERAWLWCRREPLQAALTGTALAAFGAALLGLGLFLNARERAELGEVLRRETERTAERRELDLALNECERGEIGPGLVRLAHLLPTRDPDLDGLVRLQLSAWGRHLCGWRAALDHPGVVESAAVSPDSKMLATVGVERVFLWDSSSGRRLREFEGRAGAVAFSPDGALLAVAGDRRLRLWDTRTGKLYQEVPTQGGTAGLLFTAGALVVVGSKGVETFDPGTGGSRGIAPLPEQASSDGCGLSADGKLLLTAAGNTACLWKIGQNEPVRPFPYTEAISTAALSPDGRRLVVGVGPLAYLEDAAAEKRSPRPLAQFNLNQRLEAAAFSADGRLVATAFQRSGSQNRDVRIWEATTGVPVGGPIRAAGPVKALVFVPDGSALFDGSALWTVPRLPDPLTGPGPEGFRPVAAAVSPRDGSLWVGYVGGGLRRWGADGKEKNVAILTRPGQNVDAIAFRPDGRRALMAVDGVATLVDAGTGTVLKQRRQPGETSGVAVVAFSHDGRTALTAAGWRRSMPPPEPESPGIAQLWDLRDDRFEPLGAPLRHSNAIRAIGFAPDGREVFTASCDGEVRRWDAGTGTEAGAPTRYRTALTDRRAEHPTLVSLPGGRLFTGWSDGQTRVWRPATGETGRLLWQDGAVTAMAPQPGGRMIATGSGDGTARLWWLATQQPVGPPLGHPVLVECLAFAADGRLFTAAADGTSRLWSVPEPAQRPPERLQLWARAKTGMGMQNGQAVALDPKTVDQLREELSKNGGDPLP